MRVCGHELSTEKLPNGVQPRKCDREVWSQGDGRCILHTQETIDDTSELEDIIDASNRIDGLQLAGQQLELESSFNDMSLYGGNFQNAGLAKCDFRGTDIAHTRFEGANLDHAKFGEYTEEIPDNQKNSPTKTRLDIRNNNFERAVLTGAQFQCASLLNSKFTDCNGLQGVEFIDCSLPGLMFDNQNLRDSKFSYSILRDTEFIECDFHNADFQATVLEESKFINSNLCNTDLRNAVLREPEFRNVQVDHRTQFDSLLVQEYLADQYSERYLDAEEMYEARKYLHSRRDEVPISFKDEISNREITEKLKLGVRRLCARRSGIEKPDYSKLEHARYRYRDLSRIFGTSGEPEQSREYSVREKHTKRKNALRNDNSSWGWLVLSRWTMRYGEEPIQPIKVAATIAICSVILYPALGVEYVTSGQPILYCWSCSSSLDALISVGHLSVARLLTTANPSVKPANFGVALGLFESVAGALLTAMFVFTLGRRATE